MKTKECECGGHIKMKGYSKEKGYLYKCEVCDKDYLIKYIPEND